MLSPFEIKRAIANRKKIDEHLRNAESILSATAMAAATKVLDTKTYEENLRMVDQLIMEVKKLNDETPDS